MAQSTKDWLASLSPESSAEPDPELVKTVAPTDKYLKKGIMHFGLDVVPKSIAPARPGGGSMPGLLVQNFQQIFGRGGPQESGPSTVPQNAPSVTTADTDAMSRMIDEVNKPIDPSIIKAMLTPVPSGTGIPQIPSLSRPVEAAPNLPFNREPVVGAHNARARGIGNAFTGVANAVNRISTQLKQQQQDKLSVTTQKLMSAQSAIDQANIATKTASPEQQAILKDSIKGNTELINTMLADPKMRKQLEKGLQISFTDPSQNKTPEHAGVQAGLKSFQEQFAQQMPKTMGPDPMAQVNYQLALQEKTLGQKLLQSILPRMMSAQSAMERSQLHEYFTNARFMSGQQSSWDKMYATFQQQEKMAGIRHDNRMDEIGYTYKQAYDRMTQMFNIRETDPITLENMKQKMTEDFAKNESTITSHYQAARAREQKARADLQRAMYNNDNQGAVLAKQNITQAQQDQQMSQDMLKQLQQTKQGAFAMWGSLAAAADQWRKQQQGGDTSAQPSSNIPPTTGGSGQSSTATPTNTPAFPTDPTGLLPSPSSFYSGAGLPGLFPGAGESGTSEPEQITTTDNDDQGEDGDKPD